MKYEVSEIGASTLHKILNNYNFHKLCCRKLDQSADIFQFLMNY